MDSNFYKPHYWHIWLLYWMLRAISFFPFKIQTYIGRKTGVIGKYIFVKRRKIAEENLNLCFPEWSHEKQLQILDQHFESLGLALIEFGISWWCSDAKIRSLAKIEGLENLQGVLEKNRGVILLAGHFTTLEIISRLLRLHTDFHPVYRKNNNPLLDHIINSGRLRHCSKIILRDNLRSIINSLKCNIPVLYIPDQNLGRKQCIFVPFFNIQAATTTATSRLAKIANTPVLPVIQKRLPDNKGYSLVIKKELVNFPTDDHIMDTIRLNKDFEEQIRDNPENYLWVHRRFKTRPDGEARIY